MIGVGVPKFNVVAFPRLYSPLVRETKLKREDFSGAELAQATKTAVLEMAAVASCEDSHSNASGIVACFHVFPHARQTLARQLSFPSQRGSRSMPCCRPPKLFLCGPKQRSALACMPLRRRAWASLAPSCVVLSPSCLARALGPGVLVGPCADVLLYLFRRFMSGENRETFVPLALYLLSAMTGITWTQNTSLVFQISDFAAHVARRLRFS